MSAIRNAAVVLLVGLLPGALRAEEGLWPLNNFPADKVKQSYGFAPDAAWLDRVRASAVIMGTCTGTFVSPDGLVLIEHGCVTSCLGMRATVKRSQALFGEACRDKALRKGIPLFDLLYCAPLDREEQRQSGRASFLARSPAEEVPCDNRYLRQLVSMEDVTERVHRKLEQAGPGGILKAEQAEVLALKQACQTSDRVQCDIVAPYERARWEVHKYKAFRDVRLVFSPEAEVSEFGIQGSRFTFPQHRFSAALVRVYEDGKPAHTPHLKLAETSPREGQLVFLAGYPNGTRRRSSLATLQLDRETSSWFHAIQTELRGIMHQYGKDKLEPGPAAATDRASGASVLGFRATLGALSPELMGRVQAREQVLRAKVEADPKLAQRYGQAWEAQSRALTGLLQSWRGTITENVGCGPLYGISRALVRAADEMAKPKAERSGGYADYRLPEIERFLTEPIPFDEGAETELLAFCFRLFQHELGYADPLVKKILKGRSPDEAAKEMTRHTRLPNVSARRALWKGGRAAIQASNDPFIALWRRIDGDVRAANKRNEEQVVLPLLRANSQIGRARFEVFGTSEYPDANSSLRVSFGKVAGTTAPGNTIAAFVPLSAMFGLATGKEPFVLPARWIEAKGNLDLTMPLAFTANTDVVPAVLSGRGEDGAPLIDKDLTVVGIVSGGNREAEGGAYDFKADTARAVALNSAAILHLLEQVYGAERVVQELRAAPGAPATGSR